MDRAEILAVLGDLLDAYDTGNVQMASPEIGGDYPDDPPPHPWHEEWLYRARALRDKLAAPEGGPVAWLTELDVRILRSGMDLPPTVVYSHYQKRLDGDANVPLYAHPTLPVRLETTESEETSAEAPGDASQAKGARRQDGPATSDVAELRRLISDGIWNGTIEDDERQRARALSLLETLDAGKEEREAVVRFLNRYQLEEPMLDGVLGEIIQRIERSDHLPGAAQKETRA